MELRELAPGLSVPVIGLGTSKTLEAAEQRRRGSARALVTAALDAGICLFDTSPMYGAAEKLLAKALDGRRHEAVVVTKLWSKDAPGAREQALRALEWFGGHLEVLLVHNLVEWEQHLPLLDELRTNGLVSAIGFSHWEDAAIPLVLDAIESNRFQVAELPYNATWRTIESEVLPAMADRGMGMLALRPLGQGALVQRLSDSTDAGRYTPAQRLLRWVITDQRVTCAIPATSRIEGILENTAAGEPPWATLQERQEVQAELEEHTRDAG